MPKPVRTNTFASPLDALPVIYDTLPLPRVDPDAPVPLFERPLEANARVLIAVSIGLGVFAAVGASLTFEDLKGWERATTPLIVGLVTTLISAAVIKYSSSSSHSRAEANPAPHAVVLASMRVRSVHRLRRMAGTDPAGADAIVTKRRREWSALLAAPPSGVGRVKLRAFDVRSYTWTSYLQGAAMFGPAMMLMIWIHPRFGGVWLLPVVMLAGAIVLAKFNPAAALRRRCVGTVRKQACPCCRYDLRGLEPGVPAVPAIGPRECPECAARWPLALPPTRAELAQAMT